MYNCIKAADPILEPVSVGSISTSASLTSTPIDHVQDLAIPTQVPNILVSELENPALGSTIDNEYQSSISADYLNYNNYRTLYLSLMNLSINLNLHQSPLYSECLINTLMTGSVSLSC